MTENKERYYLKIMANHFPYLMKNKFVDPRIIVNCMQGEYNHNKTHQSQNDDILR